MPSLGLERLWPWLPSRAVPNLGTAIRTIARRRRFLAAATVLLSILVVLGPVSAVANARRAHGPSGCRDPYPATRNPANPLMLWHSPGSDPLSGAHFYVPGPRHGVAARTIARLLGFNPDHFPDNYSWARFKARIHRGKAGRKLRRHPGLAWRVRMLERVADQPEPQRFSSVAFGG